MSDSGKKSKGYCNKREPNLAGGIIGTLGGHPGHNVSPILTKSVSCFDPVHTYDYFGLGPNHFHNEHIAEKNQIQQYKYS